MPKQNGANGEHVVTMREVAKAAGVSIKTVSNVVNDYEFVSQATRDKVNKAIDELGYTLNVSARNLRRGQTGIIGLAIPDLQMPYFAQLSSLVIEEAKKLGLKGIPREQLPRVRQLLPKIYLLAPLVLLVVMVSTNMYTMAFSAAIAIVAAVAVGLVNNVVEIASKSSNREDFLTFGKIIDALEGGAKGSITVAVACGVAGIISGCITVTGLASKLLSTIVSLSGGHMIIALALTMLCCIVLGMGVPTTANYCITVLS